MKESTTKNRPTTILTLLAPLPFEGGLVGALDGGLVGALVGGFVEGFVEGFWEPEG